jgi:hypothetical protein
MRNDYVRTLSGVIRREQAEQERELMAGSLGIAPFEGRRRVSGGRGQFGKVPL